MRHIFFGFVDFYKKQYTILCQFSLHIMLVLTSERLLDRNVILFAAVIEIRLINLGRINEFFAGEECVNYYP